MELIVDSSDWFTSLVRNSVTPLYRSIFWHPELYFHSPCFDGVASAVVALDFLESHLQWRSVRLSPVNYDVKRWWVSRPLAKYAAVVDFLYHPQGRFWADHHATSPVPADLLESGRSVHPFLAFDPQAPSCALLLQRHLAQHFHHRNPFYDNLVRWATKIDAARYETVQEAVFGDAPALRINRALFVGGQRYAKRLVGVLRTSSLEQAAAEPTTARLFGRARDLLLAGLARVKERAVIDEHGIVTFDITREGVIVERYAPYVFFPDARTGVHVSVPEEYVSRAAGAARRGRAFGPATLHTHDWYGNRHEQDASGVDPVCGAGRANAPSYGSTAAAVVQRPCDI
ncbi:MAG: hypothetical protein HYY76_14500 [Acidobacteria bacterium]|nr:hypothetical protein [Acidobacteriota bacterium]